MNAETLRNTYNDYFSRPDNKWTTSDLKKSVRVARKVTRWLRQLGFEKTSPKVLDVGSATGFYTEAFRLSGFTAQGLEYSDVAVAKAAALFPQCRFIHMDGFNVALKEKFDVVFVRGFSGMNTHDLPFIASWANQYMSLLNSGGFLVLAYSTNYSGKERPGETCNLSRAEIATLSGLINGTFRALKVDHYLGLISVVKKMVWRKVLRINQKDYFYLILSAP